MRRPTTWIASALVLVAGVGVYLWFAEHQSGSWTPNITVSALAAALTITVIDRAVERERRARIKPRLDTVYERIGQGLDSLSYTVATNYGLTHVHSFEPIPASVAELMTFWAERLENREPPEGIDEGLVDEVERFSKVLDAVRVRDSDVLDPNLIRAIDTYIADTAQFKLQLEDDGTMFALLRMGPALHNLVIAGEHFALAFGVYAPRWVTVDDDIREKTAILVGVRGGSPGGGAADSDAGGE